MSSVTGGARTGAFLPCDRVRIRQGTNMGQVIQKGAGLKDTRQEEEKHEPRKVCKLKH